METLDTRQEEFQGCFGYMLVTSVEDTKIGG